MRRIGFITGTQATCTGDTHSGCSAASRSVGVLASSWLCSYFIRILQLFGQFLILLGYDFLIPCLCLLICLDSVVLKHLIDRLARGKQRLFVSVRFIYGVLDELEAAFDTIPLLNHVPMELIMPFWVLWLRWSNLNAHHFSVEHVEVLIHVQIHGLEIIVFDFFPDVPQ